VQTAILGFLLAAAIVYLLTPIVTRVAHWSGAVDRPADARRMHVLATPLLGGLAIYFGVLLPVLTLVKIDNTTKGIVIGGTIVTIVGLIDDLVDIRPLVKFAGQLVAVAVAIGFDLRVTRLGIPFTGHVLHLPYTISVAFTVLWIVTIINMVNFIDGLDGLAAGVCAISSLTFSVIAISIDRSSGAVIAAVLAGATFAFLRFNFHPASIFMGDAGSMLLGYVLGVLSVQSLVKGAATVALLLPLLVLGIPFFDLFLVVFRRWRRGVPFYSPGQDHVHHDLVLVAGFSQRKSVLLLYGWCLLLNGLALAMKQKSLVAIIVLGLASAVATAYMARLLGRYRHTMPRRATAAVAAAPPPARPSAPPPARPSPYSAGTTLVDERPRTRGEGEITLTLPPGAVPAKGGEPPLSGREPSDSGRRPPGSERDARTPPAPHPVGHSPRRPPAR
jgi:UDP-GlcNAc:undecaprenyl-phosphate GlcNAc-1-phosphate transferase